MRSDYGCSVACVSDSREERSFASSSPYGEGYCYELLSSLIE